MLTFRRVNAPLAILISPTIVHQQLNFQNKSNYVSTINNKHLKFLVDFSQVNASLVIFEDCNLILVCANNCQQLNFQNKHNYFSNNKHFKPSFFVDF